jgi:hypothetical protein
MKVAMWSLELGLVDKFVEMAPVARPGHLGVCGCKKIPSRDYHYYYTCTSRHSSSIHRILVEALCDTSS